MRLLGPSLLACAALAGCQSVDSADIATRGLYADLAVEATGDGQSGVSAELRVGGDLSNVCVDLSGGDRLVASAGTASRTMTRHQDLLGRIGYEAILPTDAEGTEVRVAFQRPPDLGESAPDSAATLPAGFAITAPAPGTSHSRGAALTVAWQPARPDRMWLEVSGFCIAPELLEVPPGATSVTVGASQLRAFDRPPPGDSCDVELVLVRAREGYVDPAYGKGGSFQARQVRSLSIVSTP
jgi:hypothetical protein